MANPKISIVTFFYLSENAAGPGQGAISIAKQLHKDGYLHRIVCLGHGEIKNLPSKYFSTPPSPLFYKIFNRLTSIFGKQNGTSFRYLKEKVFDCFVSMDKSLRNSDIVLFLKPSFPKTASSLRKNRKKTVAWASIFHPAFNLSQVRKEEALYNIDWPSSYTNEKRVQSLSHFYEKLNLLLVQSELASTIFKEHGIPAEKIVRLKNTFGVDCRRFSPLPSKVYKDKLTVLHVSHMNMIKGVGYLCQAWKKLNLANSELVLVGKADQNIHSLLCKIQPPSIVRTGHQIAPDSYYQNADIFVSPSVSDANPYTIFEAMACGVPVISSNMCGAAEIISHGVDGFIYQYDSVKELQELLKWCHGNRDKLKVMGKNARKKALMYDRSDFANKIVRQIYQYMESTK